MEHQARQRCIRSGVQRQNTQRLVPLLLPGLNLSANYPKTGFSRLDAADLLPLAVAAPLA